MARVSLSLSFRSIDRSKHKLHIDHHTLMIFNLHLFCVCVCMFARLSSCLFFFWPKKKISTGKKPLLFNRLNLSNFSLHHWCCLFTFEIKFMSFIRSTYLSLSLSSIEKYGHVLFHPSTTTTSSSSKLHHYSRWSLWLCLFFIEKIRDLFIFITTENK